MKNRSLQIEQLDYKLSAYKGLTNIAVPPTGWIKAIRTAIGMSLLQLGKKLSVSKQAVTDMEKREKEGTITINSLLLVARALDMQLIYGFVPKDGSLEAYIDRRATELAAEIVKRTSATMKLEDQENTGQRISKAVRQRAEIIKNDTPKILWD